MGIITTPVRISRMNAVLKAFGIKLNAKDVLTLDYHKLDKILLQNNKVFSFDEELAYTNGPKIVGEHNKILKHISKLVYPIHPSFEYKVELDKTHNNVMHFEITIGKTIVKETIKKESDWMNSEFYDMINKLMKKVGSTYRLLNVSQGNNCDIFFVTKEQYLTIDRLYGDYPKSSCTGQQFMKDQVDKLYKSD